MAYKVFIPQIGQVDNTVQILSVYVRNGTKIKKGDLMFEIESEKASMEIEAPIDGVINSVLIKDGDDVVSGSLALEIFGATDDEVNNSGEEENSKDFLSDLIIPSHRELPINRKSSPNISPRAKKRISELNLDISNIHGTGKNGRIQFQDVEDYIKENSSNVSVEGGIPYKRRGIAEKLVKSSHDTAAVTLIRTLCVEKFLNYKVRLEQKFKNEIEHISFDILMATIVGKALKKFPNLNARFDSNGFVLKEDVNIGIAMDFGNGLFVPVFNYIESRKLIDLLNDFNHTKNNIQSGKIESISNGNGTFTITNLGGSGIRSFPPLINLPEIAILGFGEIFLEPIMKNDKIKHSRSINACLTFDHRFNDGLYCAQFLNHLSELLIDKSILDN